MNDLSAIILRYPPGSLIGDDVRAGAGVAVSAGVLTINPASWTLSIVFGAIALVFGTLGVRSLRHHLLRLTPTPEGIVVSAIGTRPLRWSEITAVKLRYYGSRRERLSEAASQGGFMQLTLRDARGRLTFESNLDGFAYLVWRAAKAAREAGVGLDAATAGNMLAVDIDPDGETRPPDDVRDMAQAVGDDGI